MRIFFASFLIMISVAFADVADFSLRNASIHQRGVLQVGETQRPVDVFIKSGKTIRLLLSCEFGTMARLELTRDGKILLLENGAFMTKHQLEKYFLRDVMMSFGFFEYFYPNIIHCVIDDVSRPYYLVSLEDDAMVIFSDYKKNGKLFIPQNVEFIRKNYNLKLKMIRGF